MGTFNPIFFYNIITANTDPYSASQFAFYPLNTNANDLINGYNGTSTNIIYTNSGIVSTSATFNGTSSLITIPDYSDFSFGTNAFTINTWVYPVGNTGFLISKRSATFAEYQSSYNISLGTVTLALYSGTTANLIGRTLNGTLTANAWNMITFTSSGGTAVGNIKGYVNAVLRTGTNQTAGTYIGVTNTTASVIFGRQGNTGAGFFNGRLDQTRFWNGRELTQIEITNIYNTLY